MNDPNETKAIEAIEAARTSAKQAQLALEECARQSQVAAEQFRVAVEAALLINTRIVPKLKIERLYFVQR